MKRAEALRLRAIVEMAAVSLDDKTASEGAMLFPRLKQNGALVPAGTRINWNGTVKKAAVDLWDTAESTPDAALTLWEDISYRDGIRIIPDAITAATAFVKGEQGWWKDALYTSLLDANVYTPEQYPAGWE
jgi:hypothetical protein